LGGRFSVSGGVTKMSVRFGGSLLLSLLSAVSVSGLGVRALDNTVDITGDKMYRGYINKKGKFVIPPRPGVGGDFHEGLAWWQDDPAPVPRVYKVIDTKGDTVFECRCDWKESDFHEGLAIVHRPEGYVYIDKKGQNAFHKTFRSASPFIRGRARVTLKDITWQQVEIDRNGKIIRAITVSDPDEYFETSSKFVDDSSGRPLFIKAPVSINHGRRSHFSEGLAWVWFKDKDHQWRIAYIDRSLHRVLLLNRDILEAGDFHDGMAPVLVANGAPNGYAFNHDLTNRLGFINRRGEIVISPKYEHRGPSHYQSFISEHFSDGIAALKSHGLTCYVDRRGREIGKFVYGGDFHQGLAAVQVPITREGAVIDVADLSHGYQNSVAYNEAFNDLIAQAVVSLYSPQPVEFRVELGQAGVVKAVIEKSNGDENFERRLVAALNAVSSPLRGVALMTNGFSERFRLEKGRILPCAEPPRRHVKTTPTLPEGTPIPDSE
jgi:hypothetical protein